MIHTAADCSHKASVASAQKVTVRGWGTFAVVLVLVCLGLAQFAGAATRMPSKTPKTGGISPPKESSKAHTYGTVRKVLSAVNLVVATPDLPSMSVRLVGVEPPVVSREAGDGGKTIPGQPYGAEAEMYIRDLLLDKQVQLDTYGKDRKGRTLAVVWLGDINVNVTLVTQGLAWVSPSIPIANVRVELEVAGRQAQVARYGLWGLPDPESPWEFRKHHHLPAE